MNIKYAAEICGNTVQNSLKKLPCLVSQGSRHMDDAILLATRWSR